jgi:uncharacterized protein (DUF2062 family)
MSSRVACLVRDLSPEEVALVLAVGLVLGIFPMCGVPTILCILVSLVARINFPALQIVNQLAWPLQVALLVPFARLGSRIIGPSNEFGATIAGRLGTAVLQAVTGWLCICLPLGLMLYFSVLCILPRSGTVNALEARHPV